ncbi:unnamed protein product [Gongylonema pulchrum]|uniref:PAM2 domain-containing protein n=1 Tax=Gongylonema pulchrum TaxID=637853 RepID=A0A183ELX4_9BILA|nr:unnamed protein product [Gongylonema pulchrum]
MPKATNAQERAVPANNLVQDTPQSQQYDQARLGTSMLPTTSQAQPNPPPPPPVVSSAAEEISSLSTMPELTESHVKDLMDELGPGKPLDDLGGDCLEELLDTGPEKQPTTEIAEANGAQNSVQSTCNSIVSPMSMNCCTSNSSASSVHQPASARCSANNSVYDSNSDQQQQQVTASSSALAGQSATQQNPVQCASTGSNTSSSTNTSVPLNTAAPGSCEQTPSIFPRFAQQQPVMSYPTPQQYGPYSAKYAAGDAVGYYPQQQICAQQQAYPSKF